MRVARFSFVSCKSRRGFTLMEIVVAMGIFALASVIIAEIFVNVQRAQRRIRDTQRASTETRYLLEVLAREVRAGAIDYSVAPTPGESVLRLVTAQGEPLVFAQGSDCGGLVGVHCVTLTRGLAGVAQPITSPNLSVTKLAFYVSPQDNPFPETVEATTPDLQPRLTVVLGTQSRHGKPEERVLIFLQTTVSSRTYAR